MIVFLPVTPEPWGRASWDLPVLERGPTSAQSSTANHPPRLPSTSYQHFPFLSPHFPLLSSSLVSRGSKDCITTRKLPTEGHTSTKMKKKKKIRIAVSVCKGEPSAGTGSGGPDRFCECSVLHFGG